MNRYQSPRPLWVVFAEELPDGGIQLIASREVTTADLRMIDKPWSDFNVRLNSWAGRGADEMTYHAMTPRLEIETRDYSVIRAPGLRAALEELYRRWRPTPGGDVSHRRIY